jgi:hypothetical protein
MVGQDRCVWSRIVRRGVFAAMALAFATICMVGSVEGGGRPGGEFGGLPTAADREDIQITPAIVSFDGVPVGEHYTQTLRLTNVTTTSVQVTRIFVSSREFTISGLSLPITLSPRNALTFTVQYEPKMAKSVRARLDVETSLGEAASVELKGTAVQSELELTASVASLDLGEIPEGSRTTTEVTLSNAGNAKIMIYKVVVFGEEFGVSGGGQVGLAPGQSASLKVSFDPRTVGASSGTLSIFSNAPDSPLQIPLSGTSLLASTQTVSLHWNESQEGASGYFVYRSNQNGGPYNRLQDAALSSTEFMDTGLAAGQTYYYVITSLKGETESNYSDQIVVTVPQE